MDIALGFHQIAKFNYFPGWHQQTSVSELLMHKPEYDKLSKQNKAILHAALNDAVAHTFVESEAKQFAAMAEMRDKHKVVVKRWPNDALAAFEKAWQEVVAEESAKDPLFKKVADSYFGYRKQFKIWLDAQKMEPTYLQ
jgi:TRAP-type mannitol/chloroaromatic compound transport system substrate-binding protein